MQNRQGPYSVVMGSGTIPGRESDWMMTHMPNRQGSHRVVKGRGQV
jgi:hypothetical protein